MRIQKSMAAALLILAVVVAIVKPPSIVHAASLTCNDVGGGSACIPNYGYDSATKDITENSKDEIDFPGQSWCLYNSTPATQIANCWAIQTSVCTSTAMSSNGTCSPLTTVYDLANNSVHGYEDCDGVATYKGIALSPGDQFNRSQETSPESATWTYKTCSSHDEHLQSSHYVYKTQTDYNNRYFTGKDTDSYY